MNPAKPGALTLCVHSGAVDKVHYALVLAAAALATGRAATLFLTGEAVWLAAAGEGWQKLGPDPQRRDAVAFEQHLAARGLGGLLELLDACRELGANFLVCDMALHLVGLARTELRADLNPQICGAVTFLGHADGAATSLFI
jgi:peroxiredoxin family protein